jgi:invasion protein IalB
LAIPLLALALPAFAQGAATDVKNFGDWTVHCVPGALPPCEMFQMTRNSANKRVTSIAIAFLPRQERYALQISTPLGVSFAKGVKIAASGFASQAMPYLRCDGAGCYVQGAIQGGALDALGASRPDARLSMASVDGRAVELPLSLRGFSDARAAMESLAREELAPAKPVAPRR